jgi:Flp pilus assembly protein TadB
MTDNADIILIIITCLVGIVCVTAVQIKKGLIMGSIWSQMGEEGTKKYVEQSEKRKSFYIYLSVAFAIIILIALLFMRDLESMAIFTILNLLFIRYFLNYFVLLKPKDKTE